MWGEREGGREGGEGREGREGRGREGGRIGEAGGARMSEEKEGGLESECTGGGQYGGVP